MIKTSGRTISPQHVHRVRVAAAVCSRLGLSVGASARRLSRRQSATHAATATPIGMAANTMPTKISDMVFMSVNMAGGYTTCDPHGFRTLVFQARRGVKRHIE
jgi:hypothetical protein